jgi:AraC-like DNA-binding protein
MIAGCRGQIWRYAPEYRRPRHFHAEPELNLIVAGTGAFGSGADVIRVSAGDLLCWPPGRDHELLEASRDFDLYVVALTPELNERVLADRNAKILAAAPHVRLSPESLVELHALCSARLGASEPSRVESHVATFWWRAHAARLTLPGRHGLTSRVLESLLERPELARSERASLVSAYPTEVSRQFRRDVGLAMNQYRTRLRLLHLVQLMDAGGRTLLAAALEAGFGSYSQCHRTFRQTIGCTPRSFFRHGVRHALAEAFAPGDAGSSGV